MSKDKGSRIKVKGSRKKDKGQRTKDKKERAKEEDKRAKEKKCQQAGSLFGFLRERKAIGSLWPWTFILAP
jgi:hypothetical protein